ncbi:MAG: alpha-amylase family glycosyl hydrolase [Halosimplex sp.]
MFPGEVEDGRVWTYDHEADAYYYHRFYPFQPDLNLANPAVREEIYKIAKFWLELGVAGFRVDAATLMIQSKHPDAEAPDDPHDVLRDLKRHVVERRSDGVLLAEADDEPRELRSYFGDGDEMDLLMNFQLNAHLVAALATESVSPLLEGLERTPYAPSGSWANFLRNYDELNLGSLDESTREEVFERFAPEGDMRIYGRGIRRRLAPMLDGDPKRIELAFSLLFSMPGTPLFLYGDEIGMGENLSLPGRRSVRTPMQWDDRPNGGFSTAPAGDLVTPVVDEGPFGFDRLNVAAQRADPDSLLNWTERLVATRRAAHEIGTNPCEPIETGTASVFAHRYRGDERTIAFVHNLADEPASVSVALEPERADSVQHVFGAGECTPRGDTTAVDLDPYGFVWFEIHRDDAVEGDGDETG